MTQVSVLGAGSWGTAFSLVLADAGNDVTLWARREEVCDTINHRRENTDYLPGIELPPTVVATHDTEKALAAADVVVFAVPSQTFRANLERWAPYVPDSAVMVSLMKGVELGTLKRMSEVIAEVTGAGPERIAVVSGPNLAKEIALRQPAASVVACADEGVAEKLQQVCHTAYFRPYTNTDVLGVEVGGAVKNVIALAVGMAKGMGMGDNSQASIITRGLAEITRLGLAQGADAATFAGLAGVGDLVATCMSPLSRNRTFGENLGKGMSLDEVVRATRQTAEGVKSAESILALARTHHVDMPIVEHVEAAVHDGLPPGEIVRRIMSRSAKSEAD
jgi:glycerol-3-phosphate dehydrogenase (NAD(P)+)